VFKKYSSSNLSAVADARAARPFTEQGKVRRCAASLRSGQEMRAGRLTSISRCESHLRSALLRRRETTYKSRGLLSSNASSVPSWTGLHPARAPCQRTRLFRRSVCWTRATRFIGPSPKVIRAMVTTTRAASLRQRTAWPMSPRVGRAIPADADAILAAWPPIGFPVLVKPAGGGAVSLCCPRKMRSQLFWTRRRALAGRMASRCFGNCGSQKLDVSFKCRDTSSFR
jgi:hypothetical protein